MLTCGSCGAGLHCSETFDAIGQLCLEIIKFGILFAHPALELLHSVAQSTSISVLIGHHSVIHLLAKLKY
jgi:hypothetical protein